jgi:hypothetical protein
MSVERKPGNKTVKRKNEERLNISLPQLRTRSTLILPLIPNRLRPKEGGLQKHPNLNFQRRILGNIFPKLHRDWCQRNPKTLFAIKRPLSGLRTTLMHLHYLAAGRRLMRIDI